VVARAVKAEAERLFRRAEEVYDRSSLPSGRCQICVEVVEMAR
jgi:hypothetical protein